MPQKETPGGNRASVQFPNNTMNATRHGRNRQRDAGPQSARQHALMVSPHHHGIEGARAPYSVLCSQMVGYGGYEK